MNEVTMMGEPTVSVREYSVDFMQAATIFTVGDGWGFRVLKREPLTVEFFKAANEPVKIRRATRVLCGTEGCMNRVLVRHGDELPAYCSICRPQQS